MRAAGRLPHPGCRPPEQSHGGLVSDTGGNVVPGALLAAVGRAVGATSTDRLAPTAGGCGGHFQKSAEFQIGHGDRAGLPAASRFEKTQDAKRLIFLRREATQVAERLFYFPEKNVITWSC